MYDPLIAHRDRQGFRKLSDRLAVLNDALSRVDWDLKLAGCPYMVPMGVFETRDGDRKAAACLMIGGAWQAPAFSGLTGELVLRRCGKCPYCRGVRRSKVSARALLDGSAVDGRSTFLTLTFADEVGLREAWDQGSRFLKDLARRAARRGLHFVSYLRNIELGAVNKRVHLHYLLVGLDPEEVVHGTTERGEWSGFYRYHKVGLRHGRVFYRPSFMEGEALVTHMWPLWPQGRIDARPVRDGDSAYVSKYLGKDAGSALGQDRAKRHEDDFVGRTVSWSTGSGSRPFFGLTGARAWAEALADLSKVPAPGMRVPLRTGELVEVPIMGTVKDRLEAELDAAGRPFGWSRDPEVRADGVDLLAALENMQAHVRRDLRSSGYSRRLADIGGNLGLSLELPADAGADR